MATLPFRATHDEDLTNAMATQIRVGRLNLDGPVEDVVRRAFQFLWGPATGGYSYADLKPRLLDAIDAARNAGPIDFNAQPT